MSKRSSQQNKNRKEQGAITVLSRSTEPSSELSANGKSLKQKINEFVPGGKTVIDFKVSITLNVNITIEKTEEYEQVD